jgi:hypothetical protein
VPVFIAGLFRDRGQADRVITALLDQGVPSDDISLAVREESEEDVVGRADLADTAFGDLAIHSAWERLGWQGGARPAYRDKVAPQIEMAFVAAGPLAIAIGGAQLGACSGGLVGSMGNFGFPLSLARDWYAKLTEGRAWVCVRTQAAQTAGITRDIFRTYDPDLPAESTRHW